MKGATDSADDLNNSVIKVNASMSTMEAISLRIKTRLTDDFYDLGKKITNYLLEPILNVTHGIENMMHSVSTGNMMASGWQKYADKTSSVQTIMAATKDDFADQAEQMAFVNEQLEKLVWFTDETSYNMIDMISNISKFTSNKVALEDAVVAMEGIALEAALSGANANQASRAMYNFSQAMGMGVVKVQDWMSIENATMATAEFKEMLIQTAAELKTVKKVRDGVYATKGKKSEELTAQTFRGTLASGWLTSEVLVETLKKYGNFTTEVANLYDLMNTRGSYTTSEILSLIKQYGKAADDTVAKQEILKEVINSSGMTAKEATELFDKLTSKEYELGMRALEAGQQAKTLKEAIDATTDAVSSKWMGIFEILFGDYVQAAELFTAIANELYDIFAQPVDNLQTLLIQWNSMAYYGDARVGDGNKYLYGRKVLIDALTSAYDNLRNIIDAVTEGFREVFPAMTGQRLFDLTVKLRDFIYSLTLSEKQLENIKIITKAVASVIDILIITFKSVYSVIFDTFGFGGIIRTAIGFIVDLIAYLGRLIILFHDFVKQSNIILDALNEFVRMVGGALMYIWQWIDCQLHLTELFKELSANITDATNIFKNWIDTLADGFSSEETTNEDVLKLKQGFRDFADTAKASIDQMGEALVQFDLLNKIKTGFGGALLFIGNIIIKIKDGVINAFADTGAAIKEAFDNGDLQKAIDLIFLTIFDIFTLKIYKQFKDYQKVLNFDLHQIGQTLNGAIGTFSGTLNSLTGVFTKMQAEIDTKILKTIARSILELAIGIYILAKAGKDNEAGLIVAGAVITALTEVIMFNVNNLLITMSNLSLDETMPAKAAVLGSVMLSLVQVAKAMLILAIAIKVLSGVGIGTIIAGGIFFAAMTLTMYSIVEGLVTVLGQMNYSPEKLAQLPIIIEAVALLTTVMSKAFTRIVIAIRLIKDPYTFSLGMGWFMGFCLLIVAIVGAVNTVLLDASPEKIAELTAYVTVLGVFFKQVSTSFMMIALAAILLGKIDRDVLEQGLWAILAIAGIFAALTLALELITVKMAGGVAAENAVVIILALGKAFKSLSVGILILAVAIAFLGKLKMSTLIQGLIALTAVLVISYAAVALLQGMDVTKLLTLGKAMLTISASILALSLALAIFTATLLLLGTLGTAGMAGLVIGLKLLVEGLIEIVIVGIGRIFEAIVTTFVAQFEIFCKSLDDLLDILIKYLPPIIDKLVDVIIIVLNGLSRRIPDLVGPLTDFFAALFDASLKFFGSEEASKGLFASIAALGSVATLSKIFAQAGKVPIKEIAKGVAVCSLILTEIIGLMTIIGAAISLIDEVTGGSAADAIKKLGDVLEQIGSAFGRLVGGLIGGIAEGVLNPIMEKLPKWGENLGSFGESVKPLMNTLGDVPSTIVDGANALATAVSAIITGEFADSLINMGMNLATGGKAGEAGVTSIDLFANTLVKLGEALVSFNNAVNGNIDEDTVTVAANSINKLADAYKTVESLNTNIVEIGMFGFASIDAFGQKIVAYGKAMVEFNNIEGIDQLNSLHAQSAAKIGEYFAQLEEYIPKQGGVWQGWAGFSDIQLFGLKMVEYIKCAIAVNELLSGKVGFSIGEGRNYMQFTTGSIGEFNMDQIRAAKMAGYSLAGLANSLPDANGVKQFIEGGKDLGEFGQTMIKYAMAVYAFNEIVTGKVGFVYKYTRADGSEGEIVHEKGNNIIWAVNNVNAIASMGEKMVGLATTLQNSTGGLTQLGPFVDDMIAFAQSLAVYNEVLNDTGLTSTVVYSTREICNIMGDVVTQADKINKKSVNTFTDTVEKLMNAGDKKKHDTDLKQFGEDLNNFSANLPGFANNLQKFKPGEISASMDSLSKFIDIGVRANDIDSGNFKTFTEAFGNVSSDSFKKFKDQFTTEQEPVKKSIALFFSRITESVPDAGKDYKNAFVDIAKEGTKVFTDDKTKNDYKLAANGLMQVVRQAIWESGTLLSNVLNNTLKSATNSIKNDSTSNGALSSFKTIGNEMMNGLIGGMNDMMDTLNNTINHICNVIPQAFKETLQINSPSKVMIGIGEGIPEGLAEGMNDGLSYVSDAINNTSTSVIQGSIKMRDRVRGALSEGNSLTPTISPIFDFNGFDSRSLNLTSSLDLNIRRPMDGLSNRILDAQSRIEASNNRVVDSINMLRQDVKDLGDKDRETNLYVDSTKLASSIAKPMDRQLNILAGRRR